MMIERILYQSTAAYEIGSLSLFNLLKKSHANNPKFEVTGQLIYFEGKFTQCIEGPKASITQLWDNLLKDARHQHLNILFQYQSANRIFSEWSMSFKTYAYLNEFDIPGFTPITQGSVTELIKLCETNQ